MDHITNNTPVPTLVLLIIQCQPFDLVRNAGYQETIMKGRTLEVNRDEYTHTLAHTPTIHCNSTTTSYHHIRYLHVLHP